MSTMSSGQFIAVVEKRFDAATDWSEIIGSLSGLKKIETGSTKPGTRTAQS